MQTPLFHQGSVLTDTDLPSLASEYGLPPDVVSELVAKLRLKGEAFSDEYPENLQEAVSELLSAIDTSPPDSKDEIVERATFGLMGAMADSPSFIITPNGVCTINPDNPPELVHAYQVVAQVLKLRNLKDELDDKSSWMLGSIIFELRAYFGEAFDPSQVAEQTEKSYNTIYTAEKVHEAFPPGKRYKVSYSHHKEALFQKIPNESRHVILKKAETFGLGPKHVRSLGVIVKKMEDDQVVKNIRSKGQAEDLIATYKENKIRYYVLDGDGCTEILGSAVSIPTGRIVIDTKNKVWRKDNGAPMEIKVPRKS